MIKEEPAFILTFPTMTQVFEARECCEKCNIEVELIPMPGQVTAGCGTAMKASPADKERIQSALKAAGIEPTKEEIVTVEA